SAMRSMFGVRYPMSPSEYVLRFVIPMSSPQMMRMLGLSAIVVPSIGAPRRDAACVNRQPRHESVSPGPLRAPYGRAMSAELPSWRETPTRAAILDFIAAVTDESHPSFVPVEGRVAVFDND